MPRETKLERIFISDEHRRAKALFPTRQSAEAVVPAILEHIAATGHTHDCRYHTHSKPTPNAVPVYISEFVLPEKLRKSKHFVPCPCCSPEFPKFGGGMIAWFEDELVIRIIGPTCFRTLNPEAHDAAISNYEAERRRLQDTNFLLSRLSGLTRMLESLDRAIVVAKATDEFHEQLHNKLGALSVELWSHVKRDGDLSVRTTESVFRRGTDGSMYSHEEHGTRVAFRLHGFQMLDPELKCLAGSLARERIKLMAFEFGGAYAARVEEMDDDDRHRYAGVLSRVINGANAKIVELEERRKFIAPIAINTLRSWGRAQGCLIPLIYSHEGSRISIAKREHQAVVVEISAAMELPIGKLDL